MGTTSDGANVRFPPPAVYAAGLAIGIAGGRLLNWPGLGLESGTRTVFGGIFILAGIALSSAGAGLFVRHRTAIIPYKTASCLVTSGIYRWTRNPMYLGLALVYGGVAALFNSLAAIVLLPLVLAIIQVRVIAREEAYLERAFGSDYLAYKMKVRRWL